MQDFRLLKILPSNTDSVKIKNLEGDKIYLKSDRRRTTTTTREPISTTNPGLDDTTTPNPNTKQPNIDIDLNVNNNVIDNTVPKPVFKTDEDISKGDTKTTTVPFDSPTSSYNLENDSDVISNDIIEEKMNTKKHSDRMIDLTGYSEQIIETTTPKTTTTTTTKTKTTIPPSKNDINVHDMQYDENDSAESYEDFAVEWHGTTLVRRNKVRVHISNEITAERGTPLRQGFLASTGYPNFYVGESNCSWTITAPIGHRIRLTVLDIHLRGNFVFYCNI